MNTKLIRIGALALGMFAFTTLYTNAGSDSGEITLRVNENPSTCNFDDFRFTGYDMTFDTLLNVSTGSNSGTWTCIDNRGGMSRAWSYTMNATDLTGENLEPIPNTNIYFRHDAVVKVGSNGCTAGTANDSTGVALSDPYTIMERAAATDSQLCEMKVANPKITVTIPANQAPGSYKSIITLDTEAASDITVTNIGGIN